jgi:hypothetical protein
MSSMFDPPKLLFQAEMRRRPHWRRLPILLLGVGGAAGAYWALAYAGRRGIAVDGLLLNVGKMLAVILAGYLTVLAGLALYRGLSRRHERIKIFDKGFSWRKRGRVYKHRWSEVNALREGAGGIYLGKRPLLTWGAHRLHMDSGSHFTFTAAHGDPRRFIAAVRRPVAHLTGTRMARTLREEEPVVLCKGLTVYPGGVEARKREIPWSKLNVRIRNGRLLIQQLAAKGKFKTVARYPVSRIDNLGGFMELAHTTIRNHQRERFKGERGTAEMPKVTVKQQGKPVG